MNDSGFDGEVNIQEEAMLYSPKADMANQMIYTVPRRRFPSQLYRLHHQISKYRYCPMRSLCYTPE